MKSKLKKVNPHRHKPICLKDVRCKYIQSEFGYQDLRHKKPKRIYMCRMGCFKMTSDIEMMPYLYCFTKYQKEKPKQAEQTKGVKPNVSEESA